MKDNPKKSGWIVSFITVFVLGLSFFLWDARKDEIHRYRIPKQHPMVVQAQESPFHTDAPISKTVSWTTPSDWEELAVTGIRKGAFLITGTNGQQAEMTVISLSGQGGGTLANINLWRDQLHLDPIHHEELPEFTNTIQHGGRTMTIVDIVSTENMIDEKYKKRFLASIYVTGNQTWFFKLVGEDSVVLDARDDFLTFLKSLQFEKG